jgi:hypothetical protein
MRASEPWWPASSRVGELPARQLLPRRPRESRRGMPPYWSPVPPTSCRTSNGNYSTALWRSVQRSSFCGSSLLIFATPWRPMNPLSYANGWRPRNDASSARWSVSPTAYRKTSRPVAAAVDTPWSNGQVEGQVNRLKALKRQMYGRAGFPLLRARVLPYLPAPAVLSGTSP